MRILWTAVLAVCWTTTAPAETYHRISADDPAGSIEWATFLESGDILAMTGAGDVRDFKKLDIESGHWIQTGGNGRLSGAEAISALSPDGRRLVTAGKATTRLLNRATGDVIRTFDAATSGTPAVFSPDNAVLAISRADGKTIVLQDAQTGAPVRTLTADRKGELTSLMFSPDGSLLAAGIVTGSATLWDVSSGKRLRTIHHRGWIYAMAFSPAGDLMACGSGMSVRIYDPFRGRHVVTLAGKESPFTSVRSLAFSPDGSRLAAGIGGNRSSLHSPHKGRVDIWNPVTAEVIHSIPAAGHILWIDFSPDGLHLAAIHFTDGRRELIVWKRETPVSTPAPVSAKPVLPPVKDDLPASEESILDKLATLKRALSVKEQTLGPAHVEVADIMEDISDLYLKMNRIIEAEVYMEQAVKIRSIASK